MFNKEFIMMEEARATAFNIFTALLCQPDDDIPIDPELFSTLILAFEIINPEIVTQIQQLQEIKSKFTQNELLIDYSKLFLGPFTVLAPPYSSIYFGRKQLMSDESMWVVDFYRKANLEFDQNLKDLPDHVAVETEFMYYLIFNEVKEFHENNIEKSKVFWEYQSTFFNEHYNKWVPKFCEQILRQSKNEYYKTLAECFKKFIELTVIPEFPVH